MDVHANCVGVGLLVPLPTQCPYKSIA
jgi:hypothetical protein